MRNVSYSSEYPSLKVDVDLLLIGHTDEEKQFLESVEVGGDDFQYYVDKIEPLMNGFSRVIYHSIEYGIEKIQEGEFKNGRQVNVGRLHAKERTIP